MSIDGNWMRRFKDARAIWDYRAGGAHASYEMASKHADFYFNTDIVASDPMLVAAIGAAFADQCQMRNLHPDWIVSYMAKVSSGLVLAARLAELLQARFGYVDLRENICRFHPAPGQAVLLVTDDIHSGASLARTIALIEQVGGAIIPLILTMGNFSGTGHYKDMPIIALFERNIRVFAPDQCPLCHQGSPALNARQMWGKLTA